MASRHSNRIGEPVFKYIDEAYTNKPDVVILEGFPKNLGISPQIITETALRGGKDGFYPNGEPTYAIELAMNHKIPFIGGEPDNKFIFDKIIARGYSANDLLSFDFVRQLPQAVKSGEMNKVSIEKHYSEYVFSKSKQYNYKGAILKFNEFKKWYFKNQNKEFSIHSGEKGETAPIDGGPYFTQKISVEVTRIRDEHIIDTIAEMMNRHESVLIIYGSSHYRIEHKALVSALGVPREIIIKTK